MRQAITHFPKFMEKQRFSIMVIYLQLPATSLYSTVTYLHESGVQCVAPQRTDYDLDNMTSHFDVLNVYFSSVSFSAGSYERELSYLNRCRSAVDLALASIEGITYIRLAVYPSLLAVEAADQFSPNIPLWPHDS